MEYEIDFDGQDGCPDCGHLRGEGHASWCENPENPANAYMFNE